MPKSRSFQFIADRSKIFSIDLCGSQIEINSEVTVLYKGP